MNYKAATELNGSVWQAYYNWGNLLYDQGITKVGEEAQALYEAAGLKYALALQLNPNIHTTAYALKRSDAKKQLITKNAEKVKALFLDSPETESEPIAMTKSSRTTTVSPPSSPPSSRHVIQSVPSTPVPGSSSSSATTTDRTPSPNPSTPESFFPSPNENSAPSPNSPYSPPSSSSSSKILSSSKSPPHSPLRPLPMVDRFSTDTSPGGTTNPMPLLLPPPNAHSLALEGGELTSLIRISQRCPSFETVEAAWTNQHITDRVISTILLNYPAHIRTLKLAGCHKCVFLIVRRSPSLTYSNLLFFSIPKSITNAAFLCPSIPSSSSNVSPLRRGKEKGESTSFEGVVYPSMDHADLSETAVTDEFILHASTLCPSLRYLELRNCSGITNKARMKASFPSLQHLSLSECGKVGDEFIADIACRCPSLRSISLALCPNITSHSLISIASHCLLIESLDLSYCKVEDEALIRLAASCSHLRSIKLAYCRSVRKSHSPPPIQPTEQLINIYYIK